MDPELIKAARRLLGELRKNDMDPDAQDAWMRKETKGKFGVAEAFEVLKTVDTKPGLKNTARSLVQGALANFGDEIIGALPGGEEKAERMRLEEEMFRDAHPGRDLAAQAIGGFIMPGGIATKLAGKGISLAKGIKLGAGIGAGTGLAAGAGAGETAEERLKGALASGGMGFVTGAAFPATAGATSRVASSATRASRRLHRAVEESGGIEAVQAQNDLIAASGRGDQATLGTLTEPLAGALDYATNANPATFRAAGRAASEQAEGMSGRMLDDIDAAVGSPVAAHRATELQAERLKWADSDAAYGGLRSKNKVFFDNAGFMQKMGGFINQPKVRDVWQEAREINLIGPHPEIATPSFEQVQSAIFKLDGAASRAFRGGDRNLGARLADAHDFLRGELRVAVPGYKAVDAEYARRLKLEKALDSGVEWYHKQGRIAEFRDHFKSLTPDEKTQFRTGHTSEFIAQLENAKTNRNTAEQMVSGSRLLGEKLKVIFDTPAKFHSFMAGAEADADMLRRARSATGGSQTARRQMEALDPAQLAAGMIGGGAAGGPPAAVGALGGILARRAPHAMQRGTAAKLGPDLLTSGHIAIDDLLEGLKRRPATSVPPWAAARLPAMTGLLGPYANRQ